MSTAFMLSLTIMVEDEVLVLKAAESVARLQIGLALEGLHTTLNISTVEYEEAEHEA